jgi:hypothetical protein
MPELDKRVEQELEVSMSLACYLTGLIDGVKLDGLSQAKDALLSNHALMTELRKALAATTRGKA